MVDEVEIISGEKIPMDEVAWATTTAATTTTSQITSSESLFTTSSNSAGESGESGVRVNGESVRKAAGSTETGEMSDAEAKKVYAYMQNWEKKNGKTNLDTDMAEKSALLTKAIKRIRSFLATVKISKFSLLVRCKRSCRLKWMFMVQPI